MSSTTGLQHPLRTASRSTGTSALPLDEGPVHPASDLPGTPRVIAVRAGQLLVWVLVTTPIALVLAGICLALIGTAFALITG